MKTKLSLQKRDRVSREYGQLLANLRRISDTSQETLARRAKIDRTYPSLLERGERSPSLLQFINISIALGRDPITVFGRLIARLHVDLEREQQK